MITEKRLRRGEKLPRKEYSAINDEITASVRKIIDDVRYNGDKKLKEYCLKFDGADLSDLFVTEKEFEECDNAVSEKFKQAIKAAYENIKHYHLKQVRTGFREEKEGIVFGQRIMPIASVGVYIPGGTASYPSTALMDIVPAKIAGVKNITVATPVKADGKVKPEVLFACKTAGADKILKAGGAQAIAALAYGTESVEAVDKIVGPGNIFVATAKREVFGTVSIDMIAGPSEVLIIADGSARAEYVAADLLSQAEHDKLSSSILVTDNNKLADAVREEIEKQLSKLKRADIARKSIDDNGVIYLVEDISEAVRISNEFAPEHLELCVKEPFEIMKDITNAGSIFLGNNSPEPLGDYYAGPNHTLPTSGTARFSSPLGVDDFIKRNSYLYYDENALDKAADDIIELAETEGLSAHAESIRIRVQNKN